MKLLVRYDGYLNSISFPEKISVGILHDFAGAISQWEQRNITNCLILNFSKVKKAFANGMLGIIAIVSKLRLRGTEVTIVLPTDKNAQHFFSTTNWSNLLDVRLPQSQYNSRTHFVQQFTSYQELPSLVSKFMDVVMRHIEMPKDILSALEWSVNEICDNVINHSNSISGGYLQVIAYPKNGIIAFTVADAGIGILSSLKEGLPELNDDLNGIQESIKAGVTRNKEFGQGNGLAGTLRITTMTGGSLDILSGKGRLLLSTNNATPFNSDKDGFQGTCVSGQIHINPEFSISKALTFGLIPYTSYNIVDSEYELEHNENTLYLSIKSQEGGVGSRAAGRELHIKILNLIEAKPEYKIILDWSDIKVIASSFADEFVGKLFNKLGKDSFEQIIKNLNLVPLVKQIIDKAITERSVL